MPKDNNSKEKKKNDIGRDNDGVNDYDPEVENEEEVDVVKIEDEEENHSQTTVTEELDEEVLDALNVKKKKKQTDNEVDYIPELERDFEDNY